MHMRTNNYTAYNMGLVTKILPKFHQTGIPLLHLLYGAGLQLHVHHILNIIAQPRMHTCTHTNTHTNTHRNTHTNTATPIH